MFISIIQKYCTNYSFIFFANKWKNKLVEITDWIKQVNMYTDTDTDLLFIVKPIQHFKVTK